ncbi:MAG: DUF11 domain-containing protein [Bacteroidales bacterium]|nr:DUF11 domain-containing protein [Bacteroidales bacterium]
MSMLNNYSLLKQTKRLLFCGIVLLWQTLFSAVNAAIVDQVELSFDHNGDSHWVDVTDLATTGTNQYFVIYVPGAYNINIDKVHWANGDWNVDTRVAESNVNWKDGTAVAGMDNAGDTYLIYGVNEANLSDFKIQYRSWNHDPASEKADFIFYIVENPNDIACRIVGTGTETGVVYDVTNTGNATSWFDNILDVEENQYVVIYSDAEDQNINFDGVKIGGTSFDPRNTVECTMYKYADQAVITSNDLNNVYAVYRATESGSLSIGYRAYHDGYQLKIFTINDFCAWDKSSNFESKYKPKITSNYLFAPPGTEINVTASWSGTDELAAPEWAFEYSTDGTNWTASPEEYVNSNVLSFDMQLNNVYVRAKITNATADMTSEGRDVSASVLINGVNNSAAACENSASQTLLWERFDLTGTWQGNNCYEQKEATSAIPYAPEDPTGYDDGAIDPTTAIRNNQYAIVRNPGYTCLGGNSGNPVWFINDYDHTGDVTADGVRQGGMMMINLASKHGYQNAVIYQRDFDGLPAGTKLYFSMFAAYATKETGRDAAVLELQILGSNDGNNWNILKSKQKTFSGSGSSKFNWEELNADGTFDSGDYNKLRLVIYNRGTGANDNGEDFVIDDILFLACRPQLEWSNQGAPLNSEQDAFVLQNSKDSWARAFGDNKTYFMVVEIADNDGNTYYAKAEVNNNGTCSTGYPCISAEDTPINLPFTVGAEGNVYDANGQKVGDDFSLDKSKLYTLQGKIYTNEAAYNADNSGSDDAVIISGQTVKVKMRPSLPIKILACENRDGSAIYNGTGLQTDLETAITNSINETDIRAIMYEGVVPVGTVGPFEVPVVTVTIDASHNPSFAYNASKQIEIANGTFEKVYTLIWEYDLGGVATPYSAQPVTLILNDLPKDLSVSTEYATQCSNAGGAVTLTENGANVVDNGTLEYQWIAGDNTNDFADNTKIISSAAALPLTNLAAGTQPYTVRVRNNNHDNNHCSTDLTQNVTIYAIPEAATLTATVNSEDVTTVCVTTPANTINLTAAVTNPEIDMAAIDQQWKYEWSIVSGPATFVIPADKTVEATTSNTAALSLIGVPFGNYTFKVKISNGTAGAENCTSIEKTIDIKVLERPTVIATATGDITANVTTACVEGATLGAATLTANVNDITGFGQSLTFDWNLTGAATDSKLNSTEKTWNLTNLAAGTYTVSCTVKNTDDCTITLTNATFTIYPKATSATLTATPGKVCLTNDATAAETTTINLSATVTPATLPAGLEWVYVFKEADGNVLSTQKTNTYTVTNVAPGAYTYLVSVYAQATSADVQNPVCDSLTAHNENQVKVYYTPVISAIEAEPEILTCTVKEAVLTAVASDAALYEWSTKSEASATQDTIHVFSAGDYSVVAYSDANKTCSSARVNKLISADANMPEISIVSDETEINCKNEELVLTANIDTKGGTIANIVWSTGKNGVDADTIHVFNANTYTAKVTLENGCEATASKGITKDVTKPTINVVAEPAKFTCAVTSTYITVNAEPTSTFEWKNNAGEPLTTNATLEPVTAPGDYTVTATSTENGCTNEKTITVEQDITAPVAQDIYSSLENDANGETATAYCAQDENKQNVAGVYFGLKSSETGVNYQLYTGGKTGTPGAAVAGTGNAISFGQLPEGTYSVLATKTATNCQTWMQFNADQPAATEEVTITKLDNPTISLTAANNVNCIAPFNGNIVVVTDGTHTSTDAYSETMTWTEYIPNVTDTVYKYQQALNDAIVYVKDANGCVNSATASIADNSATPEVFTVSGGGEKCEGTNDELTITLSDSETGFRYVLYVDGDNIADSEKQGTGDKLTWTVTDAGVYTVKAFNAETACEANMDGNATVVAHPYPTVPNVIPLKSEDATLIQDYYYENAKCNGTATGVINLSTEYIRVVNDVISADSVTWKDALNNVVTDLTKLAKGTYTLYATNFGCVSTATVEIGEPETLVIPAIEKYTEPQPGDLEMTTYYKDALCNGDESGQLVVAADFTVGGTGEVTFTLKDAQDNEVVPDVNPTAADARWTTLAKGTYTLTATDANGCDATQTVTIGEPDKLTISAAVDTTGLAPADWADNVVFINETCAGSVNGEISVGENAITGGTPFVSAAAQYNVELFKKNENDNNYTFVDNVDGVIENLKPGVYKLKATDANGCADSISVTIAAAEPVTDPVWREDVYRFTPADPQDADSKASFEICAADNMKVALEELMNRGNEHAADTIMWAYGNFETKTWIGKEALAVDSIDITVPDTFVVTAKYITPLGCESEPAEVEFRITRCTDLMLDAKVDKTEVCEGSTLTYTLTLTNNASVDAQGVNVEMILPSNLSFEETMSNDSIIYIGNIPAGTDNKVEMTFAVSADNAGENLETQFFVYSVNGETYRTMDEAIAASVNFGKTVAVTVNAMPDVLDVDEYTGLTYCVNETGVKDLSELEADEDTWSLQWGTEYIDAESDWNWSATVPVISTAAQTSPNGQQIAVRQVSDKGCIGEEAFITYIVNPNPQVSLNNVIDIKCYTGQGVSTGSIEINTDEQDGDNYAYNWYNGENFVSREQNPTGLEPGAYRLIVTNGFGCADSSIVANISDRPDSIQITFTGTELVCGGERNGVVTSWVEGGTPDYQYVWTVVGKDGVFSTESTISDLIGGDYNLELTDANGCVERNSFHIAQPDTLKIATETFTNFNCEDKKGFISLAISGGAAPYEYLWDNGSRDSYVSELEDGFYTVTVTDNNNCKADSTFQITKPEEFLTAYIESQRDVLCNGDATGQAIINVRGGTPFEDGQSDVPYIYNWTNNGGNQKDLINVPSGYYELTITDAMQCEKVIPVVIGQPEPLQVGLLHAKLDVCNGIDDGFITTSVQGGVAPYTYAWSNGENTSGIYDLAGGVYSLTVTDANNCPAEFEEEVQGYDPIDDLTINLASSDPDNRVLPGDKITFTATASRELVRYDWDYTGWGEETTFEEVFYKDKIFTLWASDGICPEVKVELPIEVVWPTIFSPYDVNGLNDEFLSPNADGKEERANWYIIVFNRYGQKVYEGKCGWDGTYKGKTALPGTYYYTIKFPNGESHDGTVEVSRQD